jgi:hypothetical protein
MTGTLKKFAVTTLLTGAALGSVGAMTHSAEARSVDAARVSSVSLTEASHLTTSASVLGSGSRFVPNICVRLGCK